MNKPRIDSKIFYVKIEDNWFKKGNILEASQNQKCLVLKVYNSWWRKILSGIFPFIKFKLLKLKLI